MKKIWIAPAISLLVLTLCGCGTDILQKPENVPPKAQEEIPAQKNAKLTYYKVSSDASHIVPVTKSVIASDATPKTAVEEMIRFDRNSKYPFLPEGLSVKSVYVEDGTAIVNFSKELKNIQKGSTSENLLIAITVNTLTEFANIKKVKFFVEGSPINSLTGHNDMRQEFVRDTSLISDK